LMYALDVQARCLTNVPGEQDRTLFLAGTQSLRLENQLCQLEVDDDWVQISKRLLPHSAGEIWHIAGSPNDSQVVATVHAAWTGSTFDYGATVWRIDADKGQLVKQARFQPPERPKKITSIEWHPTDGDRGCVVADLGFTIVDLNSETMREISNKQIETKIVAHITMAAWNPHLNGNTVAMAIGSGVQAYDIRSMSESFQIDSAHLPTVRHIDFNPNVQYTMATCGDDGRVALWDSRKCSQPLTTRNDHAHWVWQVRFNPIHDQLLLSCSSDTRLVLNSIASLSSEAPDLLAEAAAGSDEAGQNNGSEASSSVPRLGDQLLERIEEHEESVYACAWSAGDPWVFASLSYDGRVIVHRVKREHKYRILQL